MKSADAVVVGAGIAGLSTAYHLARAGRRVLVIEQQMAGAGASGRNGGHISPGIEGAWAALGREALEWWPSFAGELGDVEFRRAGGLYVVMSGDRASPSDFAAYRRARGFVAEAWSPEECRRVLPALDPTLQGGVFSPKTAQVNPHLVMTRLHDAARDAGVAIWNGATIEAIQLEGGRVAAVRASAGASVATAAIVDAAGSGASQVGRLAGVAIPVRPLRIQIVVSEALPPLTDMVWSGNGMYVRQARAGQLHFGAEGPAWDLRAARVDNEVTPATLQRIAKRFVELMPGLADTRALRSWAGVIANADDGAPIVAEAEHPGGFFVIAGNGGNGFATGAVAGRLIAERIATGHSSLDLGPYSLGRFAERSPIAALEGSVE